MPKTQRISKKLSEIDALPPLPELVTHVLEIMHDPDSSAKELAKLLNRDAALASRILRAANSSAYGLPRKVTTIELALVVLGFDEVRSLILALSFKKLIPSSKHQPAFDIFKFWMHSLACAVAAKQLANALSFKDDDVFISGMLHDIGLIIADRFFHLDLQAAIKEANEKKISLYQTEESYIGVAHDELGARLAEYWNLPRSICNVVRYHHHPSAEMTDNYRPLCALIHLAEIFSMTPELRTSDGPHGVETADEDAWGILAAAHPQLNTLDLDDYYAKTHKELKHEIALFAPLLQ